MHVHFISVEVGVIRCGNTEIKAESLVIKNFYAMTHHRHLMQRRLSIKNDVIVILEMSLNSVAKLKMRISSVL